MKTASISWTDTGYPAAIEFSPDALERLRQHTLAGLRSVSKLGVGGLLLGIRDTGTSVLRVEGLVEVPCAHDGGPSFSLTAEELTHALGLVRAPRGLSVLGWYVSRTQPPLAPRATDLNLYATLCPASWQIMVMIRPGAAETTKGVVIFRDPSGEIVSGAVRDIPEQGDASGLAAVPPMPGPDTQAAYRQAERADASAGRAASGATSKKRSQPEGAHGFEPVRSYQLMPEKQAVSGPAGAVKSTAPSAGAPRVVGKSVFQRNPFAVASTPKPVVSPADTRGGLGQSVSRPAGEANSKGSAPDAPGVARKSVFQQNPFAPPAGTRGAEGPDDFEAVRFHNLIRGNQPAKAPDGDGERSASRPGARVVRSGPASESRAPAAPRRRRLVTGAVVAAAFSLVAWATSSLWLAAPLRLELTEAGGHITAIWNTDGVARGVAGFLVVTDSGKIVTIPLNPEKAITGVAGYNLKSGKISATLHIGDQEAKAEWRAPDNWAPPAAPELKPGADEKPKP
jgi:hypothetical protein